MCRLIETIKIKNNKIFNLAYHNKRLNYSRKNLFDADNEIDLSDIIELPEDKDKIFKCRVIYNRQIEKIEITQYEKRKITSLKLVYADDIDYTFKYENRDELDKLLLQKNNCDEILIVKNKMITDTSFTNVILYDGKKLYTPKFPLLKGTKREQLLDEKIILEKEIFVNELKYFKKIFLINSMLDLEDSIPINIENIF